MEMRGNNVDLLSEGIEQFNVARFFEAHEVWEDLWRATEGELKLFYQGLIQAAVGLVHAQRGNAVGARNQIAKSLAKLERYPGAYAGLDNAALITCLKRSLDAISDGRTAAALESVRIVPL